MHKARLLVLSATFVRFSYDGHLGNFNNIFQLSTHEVSWERPSVQLLQWHQYLACTHSGTAGFNGWGRLINLSPNKKFERVNTKISPFLF